MSASTLLNALSERAKTGEFAGATAITSFGDSVAEFRAIRESCGISARSWSAKLIISGEDRVRWTNGMVTNNIRDLAINFGNYNFVLNAQGRVQGDCIIYNRGEHLMLTTDLAQLERLKQFFDEHIIMDDVELTDVSDKLASLEVIGPKASEALSFAGFKVPQPGEILDAHWQELGYSITSNGAAFEIWLALDNVLRVWEELISSKAVPVGSMAIEWMRIASGTPRYGLDITDRDLPQETAQMHALHYSKGCYIGQEIVERIRSRGNVHKTLVGLEFPGELPSQGMKIMAVDKEAGTLGSTAAIPLENGIAKIGLAILRRDASAPGTELEIDGQRARACALPFKIDK